MDSKKPELTFYCELKQNDLVELFNNRFVIDDLKTLDARLSLGILDMSKERAQVVKKLNKIGVKVIAWLLLPESDGYWFNIDNADKAMLLYDDFINWTIENNLKWEGIGLDIEPDISWIKTLKTQKFRKLLDIIGRLRNKTKLAKAKEIYTNLVAKMHDDGYVVVSYHFPFIVDERIAKSTVVQRVAGLVDLETDCEVLMLYSSFLRPYGHQILWNYAKDSDSVGIGNTGGGVDLAKVNEVAPMTWEEFSKDLLLAHKHQKPIHIFCLEGCVDQGFLERLITFDWEQEISPPLGNSISRIRSIVHALLWLLQRTWIILLSISSVIGTIFYFKKRR